MSKESEVESCLKMQGSAWNGKVANSFVTKTEPQPQGTIWLAVPRDNFVGLNPGQHASVIKP